MVTGEAAFSGTNVLFVSGLFSPQTAVVASDSRGSRVSGQLDEVTFCDTALLLVFFHPAASLSFSLLVFPLKPNVWWLKVRFLMFSVLISCVLHRSCRVFPLPLSPAFNSTANVDSLTSDMWFSFSR